jgi:hypothetical protein
MSDTVSTGMAQPASSANDTNSQQFLARMLINKVWTSTIVQVKGVTNAGGVSAVGFVDVQPMVNQVDGAGKATPHDTIYGIPYFRLQGGTDAVILDPKVNDLGICLFAHSDVSSVKNKKGQANPGSQRKHQAADGMYIGGLLNGIPQQFIAFTTSGIAITSPTKITLTAPVVEVDATTGYNVNSPTTALSANLTIGGSTVGTGTGKFANVGVPTHTHVDSKGGTTSKPNAGT